LIARLRGRRHRIETVATHHAGGGEADRRRENLVVLIPGVDNAVGVDVQVEGMMIQPVID